MSNRRFARLMPKLITLAANGVVLAALTQAVAPATASADVNALAAHRSPASHLAPDTSHRSAKMPYRPMIKTHLDPTHSHLGPTIKSHL